MAMFIFLLLISSVLFPFLKPENYDGIGYGLKNEDDRVEADSKNEDDRVNEDSTISVSRIRQTRAAHNPFRNLTTEYVCSQRSGKFTDPRDCKSYIICINRVAQKKVCSKDEEWSRKKMKCVPSEESDCELKCPLKNGKFPYYDNCGVYIQCKNGMPYIRKCPPGLFFSMTFLTCQKHSRGLCPLEFQCPKHFITFPVLSDCNLFLECEGNPPWSRSNTHVTVGACPGGLFYDYLVERCVSDGSSVCANHCPESSGIFGMTRLCNYYKICTDYIPEILTCPDDLYFDPIDKECDIRDKVLCEPHCCCDGELHPMPGNFKYYYVCKAGVPKTKSCGKIEHWNHLFQKCEIPNGVMSYEYKCPQRNGLYPVVGKCSEYLFCDKGIPLLKNCSEGLAYNDEIKTCTSDLTSCGIKCLEPFGDFPIAGDCKSFIRCFDNMYEVIKCPHTWLFDAVTKECSEPETTFCNAPCPHPNGRFPLPWPHGKEFLECHNNVSSIIKCPPGLMFHPEFDNCV